MGGIGGLGGGMPKVDSTHIPVLSTVCDLCAVVYGELLLCLTDKMLYCKLWLFPSRGKKKGEGEINSLISFSSADSLRQLRAWEFTVYKVV